MLQWLMLLLQCDVTMGDVCYNVMLQGQNSVLEASTQGAKLTLTLTLALKLNYSKTHSHTQPNII